MRIISKFMDYYDPISAYDHEREILYLRDQSEAEIDPKKYNLPTFHAGYIRRNQSDSVWAGAVGFCGKVYPWIQFYNYREFNHHFYSIEDIDQFVESQYSAEAFKEYKTGKFARKFDWSHSFTRKRLSEYFNLYTESYAARLFDEYEVPLFSIQTESTYDKNWKRRTILTKNCCLNNFDFKRIFDPYTCYQELSMYMNNMAFPNKPIPHVSDEDLITAKGFDKFSFRKDPSRKR